uniref:Uncharacterized protein n=1 Tax=Coccidioides posadasii RMSCC 3488 TaxID=454284 RepID=A0A0J6F7Z1_COCPO|nr:hypothetical protein CPAG_01766 [Coccidioides posadasii RMSCC 3488]
MIKRDIGQMQRSDRRRRSLSLLGNYYITMYDDVQPEIRTLLLSVEKIKLDSSSIARLCYRSSPLLHTDTVRATSLPRRS